MVAALTFHAFWSLEIENGDLMVPDGDPKTEKGPHGDPGPQMGTHLGAVKLAQKQCFFGQKTPFSAKKFPFLGGYPLFR